MRCEARYVDSECTTFTVSSSRKFYASRRLAGAPVTRGVDFPALVDALARVERRKDATKRLVLGIARVCGVSPCEMRGVELARSAGLTKKGAYNVLYAAIDAGLIVRQPVEGSRSYAYAIHPDYAERRRRAAR